MTSAVPISAIIDGLIQRIDNVTVFQDHWKLVASGLTQLRHKVNEKNLVQDKGHLQEDIDRTLELIGGAVTSCTGNETDLNVITYRDLESLLLQLQLRLVQHEVDLTDDYQTKVEILSKNYHKTQILNQKHFDETLKQRLETAEQHTKAKTEEQLRLLHQKYAATIESYLRRCTQLHKSVPLSGVTGIIVAKIAHSFYDVSQKSQIQLERNWQGCELPLTRSFVQFKTDKSTSFERNESRRLISGPEVSLLRGPHSRKEASKGVWQRLVSAPYMMSMIERDRYEQKEDVTEENIIRTKRWIVILGDPGSGKTSFSRWLARHLAQTLLLNGQHSTDYGPLRIPILIRIGEFAEMLKEQPSLTLFDYMGKHKWMGKAIVDDPSLSLNDLSCTLQDYIKHGQALIILDGLDEIPVSDQRSLIINGVENFADKYVQTPTGVSAFDNAYLSRLLDDPSRSGGNQLIVTSRIVGYHAAPLAGQFAHYTIRPMDMEHMKDFVDYWFFRVHQQILDTLDLSIPNQGENHGEVLKKELEKTENSGLLDVASNSCLLSFICSVAFSQLKGSPLPTQRILLYEEIVNSMLSLWSSKGSTINVRKLIRILSDIATYIHEYSASGLIHEEKMKEVCIQSLKSFLNKKLFTNEDLRGVEDQACEFVRIFREDVGILAARGESLYSFLHLTFQEYFTCLKLIDIDKLKQKVLATEGSCLDNKVQLVSQSLRQHISDPRFRVPIALALGQMSATWSEKDFDSFCRDFIQEQDESDSLASFGAYMLISCGNDLVNYPSNDVLFDALDHLMISAGQHNWSVVCPFLFDQIINALRKLRHDIVSLWVSTFLSRSSSHNIQTISALCHLLEGKPHEFENIKWLNQSSCCMLQDLSSLDNENNGFAIDRLLVKITFSNHRLLPVDSTTFKGYLLTDEIELNSIPVVLFPLIITLYGGLKRDGETVVFDPFYIYRESIAITPILVRFLSRNNPERQDETIMLIKQECLRLLLTRIQNHDESPETIDLCIATICLYGIDYVQQNAKMISNSLICMVMNRFKYISMILRQFYFTSNKDDYSIENETTKFISTVIENFQYVETAKTQFLNLLNSLRSGVARLRSSITSLLLEGESTPDKRGTLNLPNCLRKEYDFLDHLLFTDKSFYLDKKSCSLLHHFTKLFWVLEHNEKFDTQLRMAVAMDTIPEYLVFRNDEDPLFPLTFVPSHLQNLYLQLMKQKFIMINSADFIADAKRYLSYGHILLECLMVISNTSCKRLSTFAALEALLPCLRMFRLENFASSLLWTLDIRDSSQLSEFEFARQLQMNYETGLYVNKIEYFGVGKDMTDEERRVLIDKCIEQEYQRLKDALAENDGTSMKLYSACVSLAQVCRWSDDKNRLHLLEECVQGAMSIKNKLVRLDALCIIAFYSHSVYDQIQVNQERSLQQEIDYQLHEMYPELPLLLHTAIFIRSLPLLRQQQTIEKCLQNLFNKLNDAEQKDQEVVYEALSPYLKLTFAASSISESISNNFLDYDKTINNKSSVLMEYFTNQKDENFSSSLLIPNLYLVELASDLQNSIADDDLRSVVSCSNLPTIDNVIASTLFQLEGPVLTVAQAMTITNILTSTSSSDKSEKLRRVCIVLNNALHHFTIVEFKACRLLECWLKWKDSNVLSSFACHAALLLANSDLWSVEAAIIVCDLLCCENDRFRQRAEMILRSKGDDNDFRRSSTLGLDVLLTLATKKAHFSHSSPSANLTLLRTFENTTLDNRSHLCTYLWLERYRLYALAIKEYSLNKSKISTIPHVALYFSNGIAIDVSVCSTIRRLTHDLIRYMCKLIALNFSTFLEIDGDTTSNAVMESHNQFVVSVLISVGTSINYTDEIRALVIDTLTNLLEISDNDEIRRAAASVVGYIGNEKTYKILFKKLQMSVKIESNNSNYIDYIVCPLISSYCHCVAINNIKFDHDDLDLFRQLLQHFSSNILQATRTGLGRVLKDNSLLLEMLGSDYIQCYHALIDSTAYSYLYKIWQSSVDAVAEFIEQHPDLLPIFIVELYNSIRHFTNDVLYVMTTEYFLVYGQRRYVEVASLIAVRMPAAFCTFIKDWHEGDNLKRALFYTSKQHSFPQRAACLTILSIFGELTVELCEMIVEALRDDPHLQNTCYKCLTRINSIEDDKAVLNLLFSYLKSKSMNVRYVAAKMLLHLSKCSLIPLNQVQTVLNEVILDPSSNEDLWLITEQDKIIMECVYYYVGRLKDVIYFLLAQHLTGDASETIPRNELSDIDSNFVESEEASRLASCLYETKNEEEVNEEEPAKSTYFIETSEDSKSHLSSSTEDESDHDVRPHIDGSQGIDNHQRLLEDEQPLVEVVNTPIENIMINNGNEEYANDNVVQASIVKKDMNSQQSSSQTKISTPKKSKMCTIV